MKNRTISWLGLIPILLWLTPIFAKKVSPELFGGPLFQWTTAAANALLIPLLVLLALKLLTTPNRKKAGLGLLFAAGFPLVALLFSYGVASLMLARPSMFLAKGDRVMLDRLPALIDAARDHENPAKRRQAARALHILFGITPVWRNEAGELEVYELDDKDRQKWDSTSESNRTAGSVLELLDGQLRQMPWLFAMNLGAFVLITGAGFLWHVYRKPREDSVVETN